MSITHYSEFCGVGGESAGADQVPGVETIAGANHSQDATDSFALNFPNAQVFTADITKLPIDKMPWACLFTASPACPAWTTANGLTRDFDKANAEQSTLFGSPKVEDAKTVKRRAEYRRSRLLMREVIRYLRAWVERGRPVPIGFLENVIQVRLWHEWDAYRQEFDKLGYDTRLIAFNSMHAVPRRSRRAPQSRDRAYLAFWHRSLGRRPDWDKWLRPKAWCPQCLTMVDPMQVWKKPGVDMGSYRTQYIYQCPTVTCRREVFPEVRPALTALDPTIPGIRLGDRAGRGMDPLVPATMQRIATGVCRYWLPLLVPTGGTWRADGHNGASPLTAPMPTRTTRECDGIVYAPPLMVPVEGRPGKVATSGAHPMRTQTTRAETGVAYLPPFVTPLRGGGDVGNARSIWEPLSTVTASGNHHGIATPLPTLVMRNQTASSGENRCTPATEPMRTLTASSQQALLTAWAEQLLVPFYSTADSAYPTTEPMGTLTTHDRYGLAGAPDPDWAAWERELADATVEKLYDLLAGVYFRMLEPHEVASAMGFPNDYRVAPRAKRRRVRLFGNAVTPCVSEIITSALVECLTGEPVPTGYDDPSPFVSGWAQLGAM